MSDIIFEQVLELAKQLPSDERAEWVEQLQDTLPRKFSGQVTREMLLEEHARLKAAGAFDHVESLYGKYANPKVDISFEELQAYLHEVGTEWEKERDEIIGDE
jgi:hypothetical protein